MEIVSISEREFLRPDVPLDLDAGRTSATEANGLINLGRGQVVKLLLALRRRGSMSLISKRRGCPSNIRLLAAARTLAVALAPRNDQGENDATIRIRTPPRGCRREGVDFRVRLTCFSGAC